MNPLLACVSCNAELIETIFGQNWLPLTGMVVSQFLFVGIIVSFLDRLR
ncbi:MAG: hypothetical protein SFU53_12110 [Terrimicrobiaceae bacterium]|nr:hypothetical protein [Terrimicrobiaceae bacterium]